MFHAIAITLIFVAATSGLGVLAAASRWTETKRVRDIFAAFFGAGMTAWLIFCAVWVFARTLMN